MSNLINQRILHLFSRNSSLKYGSLIKNQSGGSNLMLGKSSLISPINQRLLYTANYLGVDAFENQRTKVSGQFGHLKDNLIERMRSTIEGKNKMIFSEDLKNSIFLINNQPDDVALLKQVISKYTEQATDIKFSTYQFGPVVMRLFYLFGDCETAYEMLMETKYNDFFSQDRSYLIAMDLCWEKGKYQQILDLYDRFKSIEGKETKYPRDIITLVAAACFKLNTAESFKYCLNLFVGIRESKARLTRRAISFFSALALKQNDPEVALESLTLIEAPANSSILLSIRLMALASLKRIDDILYIIRNIINRGRPIERPIVLSESVDKIEAAVESSENEEVKSDWQNIKRALQENKLIQEGLIEPVLCNPIERMIRTDQQFRQGSGSGQYGFGAGQLRDNRFRGGPRGERGFVGGERGFAGGERGFAGGERGFSGGERGFSRDERGGYRRNDNYSGQRRRSFDSPNSDDYREDGSSSNY